MIVWDGMDIVCLIILAICIAVLGLGWLWITIIENIDKYFERRRR